MRRGLIRVNLPKAREPLEGLLVRQNAYTKRRLDFDICIERDLCAGKQANSNMRFADRGETARAKRRLDFDICIERDLCAGKQANSNMRFADRGETARDRVIEL